MNRNLFSLSWAEMVNSAFDQSGNHKTSVKFSWESPLDRYHECDLFLLVAYGWSPPCFKILWTSPFLNFLNFYILVLIFTNSLALHISIWRGNWLKLGEQANNNYRPSSVRCQSLIAVHPLAWGWMKVLSSLNQTSAPLAPLVAI